MRAHPGGLGKREAASRQRRRVGRIEDLFARELDTCFRRRALAVLDFLRPEPGDRIVDLGCGRGFYCHALFEIAGVAAVGVDADPAVLPDARRVAPRSTILRADVTRLPFADASFDKAIFSEVLEHVPDDRAALRELRRVLRPGGVAALTVPNAHYPVLWDPVNWALEHAHLSPIRTGLLAGIWAGHERLYREPELVELVQEAGFAIGEARLITRYCVPFSHNLLYGIGKPLVFGGWLPHWLSRQANRFEIDAPPASPMHPFNVLRRALGTIDALNDVRPPDRTSVIIALKLGTPVT